MTLAGGIAVATQPSTAVAAADAGQNASISLTKTVGSVTFEPLLSVSLAADRQSALPGDRISYTGAVSNTGVRLTMTGQIVAASSAEVTGTVASWYDQLEYKDRASNTWIPIAGQAASRPQYSATVTPGATAGLSLTATPKPADGVAYPASSIDELLSTRIGPHATATWSYTAQVTLSTDQQLVLADPKRVAGMRNVLHVEITPRDPQNGQPYISRPDAVDPLVGAPSAVHDVVATLALPGDGSTVFDASVVPALGSIAPGATVHLAETYRVPVVPAHGTDEADTDYLDRLHAVDGRTLTVTLTAGGKAPDGTTVVAQPVGVAQPSDPRATVTTTERLPVVSVSKSGPATVDAGTPAGYDITIHNDGSAPAEGLRVRDDLPGGAGADVTGVPDGLALGAVAVTSSHYVIPDSQPDGPLTDTATVSWSDHNGNGYGPVAATWTSDVHSTYAGASLHLTPETAGPDVVGTRQQLTAVLLDRTGQPMAGVDVRFSVLGANSVSGNTTTDAQGRATFDYHGQSEGTDTAQAVVVSGTRQISSNTASVGWIVPVQPVSSTTVEGRFFAEPAGTTKFVARPGDTPAFGQSFPALTFDPPAGIVPNNRTGVGPTTRPFADVTTDVVGNGLGTIPAEGNGKQAGVGSMACFNAAFTADLTVARASDVTFRFQYGTGFRFGVGGGATRVNGLFENVSAGAVAVFEGYPLVGADETYLSTVRNGTVTVHFPAAGAYPYEVDYTGCGSQLSLVMQTVSFTADTSGLSAYVGYADGLRPAGSIFPYPWSGSPDTVFVGCAGSCQFDGGAIRLDNTTGQAVTINSLTVDFGPNCRFAIWPHDKVLQDGQSAIFAQMISGASSGCPNDGTFDSSDAPYITCSPTHIIPHITFTIDGATHSFDDTDQILNTKGVDLADCPGGNESHAWQRIGGAAVGVGHPLPPAASVRLTPLRTIETTVGKEVTAEVGVTDGSGHPVADTTAYLTVTGANGRAPMMAVTDAGGLASFTYAGTQDGTDSLEASAFVTGMRGVSNTVTVVWTVPPYTPPSPTPTPTDTDTGTPAPTPTGTDTGTPAPMPTGTDSGSPTPSPSTTTPAPVYTGPLGAPPVVSGVQPVDGTKVTAPVPVKATVVPPTGASTVSWRVTATPLAGGTTTTLASGTGAPPSTLATFDPTTRPNGAYRILVSATASTGGVQTTESVVLVDGDLKLGRFVRHYRDLSVPVSGFRMTLGRDYDSADSRTGDFGVGWRVTLSSVSVRANRPLGARGWVQYDANCIFGLCTPAYTSDIQHYVTVTYPNGHQDVFDFTPIGNAFDYWSVEAAFTPRPGTTSTLESLSSTSLVDQGDGNLYDDDTFEPYDPKLFQLTLRDGRVLVLDVDSGLRSITDPAGNRLTVGPDGVTSSSGPAIRFVRDGVGRITQVTGPAGETLRYQYDAAGDLTASTAATGGRTTYRYDRHRLIETDGPDGSPQSIETYDPQTGRLTSITDATGHTTAVTFDVDARSTTTHDASGRLTTVDTMDDRGDVVRHTEIADGETHTTTTTYDDLGRPLQVVDAAGHTTRQTYDAKGDQLTLTDADGRTLSNTYDQQGRLLTSTDPSGRVTANQYDAQGNVVSRQHPDGTVTHYGYDSRGLLTSVSSAAGSVGYGHDAVGRITSITEAGNAIQLGYDASGGVTSVTDSLGAVTRYLRDADGRVSVVTDPNGNTQAYERNQVGLVTGYTDALGHRIGYTYDGTDRVVTRTDRNGAVSSYDYDADGRLTKVSTPDGVTTYGYDGFGRLTTLANDTARVTFGYDPTGLRTSEKTEPVGSTDLPATTVSYAYDPSGALTRVDGPGGSTSYGYDAKTGLLLQVADSAAGTFDYRYDAGGRMVALVRPNGVDDTLGYDAGNRITGLSSTRQGTVLSSTTYHYGVGSLVDSIERDGSVTTYGYDADRRLTSVVPGDGSASTAESFSYDKSGNLSPADQQWTYGPENQLLSDGSHVYAYDADGQLVTRTDLSSGSVTRYTWNADHQLTSVRTNDQPATTFRYDPLGRRVEVSDGTHVTRTVYGGDNVLAEFDGSDRLRTQYALTPGSGPALASTTAGVTRYQITDAQGSTVATTDASGAVTGRYRFSAYGVPAQDNPADGSFGQLGYDQSAGLYHADARDYDPSVGRFLSEDPEASTNAYAYAGGNPVSRVDPTGRTSLGEIEAAQADSGIIDDAEAAEANSVRDAVYRFFDCNSKKFYYGISKNVRTRLLQHAAAGVRKPLRGLATIISADIGTRLMMRGMEQVLIENAGIDNLSNINNSIAEGNPVYEEAVAEAEAALGDDLLAAESALIQDAEATAALAAQC